MHEMRYKFNLMNSFDTSVSVSGIQCFINGTANYSGSKGCLPLCLIIYALFVLFVLTFYNVPMELCLCQQVVRSTTVHRIVRSEAAKLFENTELVNETPFLANICMLPK